MKVRLSNSIAINWNNVNTKSLWSVTGTLWNISRASYKSQPPGLVREMNNDVISSRCNRLYIALTDG